MQQIQGTTPTELRDAIEDGEPITVVDVRQPYEFERGHIEAGNVETVNVPLTQLQALDPNALLEDVSTERVVTVCASGNRSSMGTRLLNQAGIDAENLQGGMRGWQRAAQ